MKNSIRSWLLVIAFCSLENLQAGKGGSTFGAAVGGSFLGTTVSNVLTQPRTTRTEVVQVQPAPAPREDYDNSAALRKLRKENRALAQENDELMDEVAELKREIRKLKAENKRLEENARHHHHHTKTLVTTTTTKATK